MLIWRWAGKRLEQSGTMAIWRLWYWCHYQDHCDSFFLYFFILWREEKGRGGERRVLACPAGRAHSHCNIFVPSSMGVGGSCYVSRAWRWAACRPVPTKCPFLLLSPSGLRQKCSPYCAPTLFPWWQLYQTRPSANKVLGLESWFCHFLHVWPRTSNWVSFCTLCVLTWKMGVIIAVLTLTW